MQLTGVAPRFVYYTVYEAALADSADLTPVKNGVVTVIGGTGGSACQLKLSGNGTVWSTALDGPGYPVVLATNTTGNSRIHNASGGPVVVHLSGWSVT